MVEAAKKGPASIARLKTRSPLLLLENLKTKDE